MDKETLQRAVSVQKSITELSAFKRRLVDHVFSIERQLLKDLIKDDYEDETKKTLKLLIHKHLRNMEDDLRFNILQKIDFLNGL